MESEEEEKTNQQKIAEQNILTEDEIINSLDMKIYRERIENIIGKQYSFLFFVYFDNIYHSKIKNKISLALTEDLNKENNQNNTFWMHIYKSIKFYSRENLPIIINKYFNLKAEYEFKFLYNESKKYTSSPHKFFDVYLKKMKKANNKKLLESKATNKNSNIFDVNKKPSIFIRQFLTKKTIMRPKLSLYRNNLNFNNNNFEDEHSELSNKEEEIKNKKERRLQIIKQIHQLKINSIKEVEKANILQNKQKKKYGGIKSRFLNIFIEQEKFFKIINHNLSRKITYNNINYNYQKTEFDRINNSSKRIFNNSKSSNKNLLYLYTKENYTSRKNLKFDLNKRRINSSKKNINRNKFYNGILSKRYIPKNLKALNYFLVDKNNNNNNKIKKNEYIKNNSNSNYTKKNSGLNLKKIDTNNLIKKINKKRNKEILENLKKQKDDNEGYNNIIYNIFKRTEIY